MTTIHPPAIVDPNAVIGKNVASELFPNTRPLGKEVKVEINTFSLINTVFSNIGGGAFTEPSVINPRFSNVFISSCSA